LQPFAVAKAKQRKPPDQIVRLSPKRDGTTTDHISTTRDRFPTGDPAHDVGGYSTPFTR
jgi:hypothetical protein